MIEGLIVLSIVLLLITCFSAYYAVKFGLVILRLEDVIEESIDRLDDSQKKLSLILEKPIFFDSIEVRQCIDEIKNSRLLMLEIANNLTSINNKEYEEDKIVESNSSKEKED